MLELLLCTLEGLGGADAVEVGQDAHHLGKAMGLEHVEKLKGFHLEAKAGVDHEEDQVGNLGQVDHRIDLVGALVKGQPPVLARNHGHRAQDCARVCVCVGGGCKEMG